MIETRLTQSWERVLPAIKRKWPALTESDFESVEGQPGKLVEAIRKRYHRGRSGITIEAKILDWVNRELGQAEASSFLE